MMCTNRLQAAVTFQLMATKAASSGILMKVSAKPPFFRIYYEVFVTIPGDTHSGCKEAGLPVYP